VTEVIRRIGPAKPDPRADLAQLRERIAQARGIMAPRGSCCGHCFGSGAAAVLRILDGEA
jgi:hypothetical protein